MVDQADSGELHGTHQAPSLVDASRPAARAWRDAAAVPQGLRDYADRSPLAIALIESTPELLRYANPAFRRLCGTDGSSMLGGPVRDAVPSSCADRVCALLHEVHRTGEAQSGVELEVASDETGAAAAVWSVTMWPVPAHGGYPDCGMLQVCDVTASVRERRSRGQMVTELREINERLLLSSLREEELKDQAEAASEAKSVFLATMSHEFRTPLSAIMGYEELLAGGITGPVTDAQRAQLERIKLSASHLLALIDEMLTLARTEVHREEVNWEMVNVAELLEGTTALITPVAASKGLSFTVELPDRPITLYTDPLKVRQILGNLLANAVKYSDRGEIALVVRSDRDMIAFEVRDTGIGIRPEHIERIFDTFYQVHQTHSRKVGGAGLGLSVARRLARLLGGDVTVASQVGRGSTFTLWLPRVEPPATLVDAANATR